MSVWVCFHKKKIYDQEEHFGITHAQSNRYYHLHPLSFCQSAGINQKRVCKKPLQRVIKRYSHFLQQTEESKGILWLQSLWGLDCLNGLLEKSLWKGTLNFARSVFLLASSTAWYCWLSKDNIFNNPFIVSFVLSGIFILMVAPIPSSC